MAKDSDVARVAAAMNAPGFRYRSFGNEPVRIRPGQAGTLAQPLTQPPAMPEPEAYAPPEAPSMMSEMPPSDALLSNYETLPDHFDMGAHVGFGVTSSNVDLEPEPMSAAMMPLPEPEPLPVMPPLPEPLSMSPLPVAVAAEPPVPEPAPTPLFSWPETPAPMAPPPQPVSLLPEVARAYAPASYAAPAEESEPASYRPGGGGGFRLLESIGHRAEDTGVPRGDSAAGGTLGMLRNAIASAPSDSTMAGILAGVGGTMPTGAGFGATSGLSLGNTAAQMAGLLPAASVTVPLSDVMRLIAAGATPPPSPFDAFRAALGAQPGR